MSLTAYLILFAVLCLIACFFNYACSKVSGNDADQPPNQGKVHVPPKPVPLPRDDQPTNPTATTETELTWPPLDWVDTMRKDPGL
jgi:hypothetical protein